MRNWSDPAAFQTSRFLYLYRLVGVTMFEVFNARWMLLVSLLVAMFDLMRSGRGANDGRKPVFTTVRAERARRAALTTATY